MLSDKEVKDLAKKANEIRVSTVESLIEAGSGHTAGPLGMADIFTYLYFHEMKHDPKNPDWDERDMFVLSNGHICPGLYATMAHAGYFPVEELKTLRKFGSRLQGHPHREFLPMIETSSGPLGCGLSQAIGMALSLRMDSAWSPGINSHRYVYCMMGDGELNEGNIWEAAMLGGKEKLHNVIGIIDRNNIQIDGYTEDVMPLDPLREKWESFGWHVEEIDAHNFFDIQNGLGRAKAVFERPSVIIAHSIPGKGVTEIENDYRWHGAPPGKGPEDVWQKADQGAAMLKELRSLNGKITGEHE